MAGPQQRTPLCHLLRSPGWACSWPPPRRLRKSVRSFPAMRPSVLSRCDWKHPRSQFRLPWNEGTSPLCGCHEWLQWPFAWLMLVHVRNRDSVPLRNLLATWEPDMGRDALQSGVQPCICWCCVHFKFVLGCWLRIKESVHTPRHPRHPGQRKRHIVRTSQNFVLLSGWSVVNHHWGCTQWNEGTREFDATPMAQC